MYYLYTQLSKPPHPLCACSLRPRTPARHPHKTRALIMWQRATAPLLPAYPAHTTSHKHTHTRQSDTPIILHSIRGPAAPHSLLSAALTWTSLSSSLYNHHHKNTRHTHTNTSRLFCPSATSLLSLLSFSRPLFIPPVALQNLQTSRHIVIILPSQ